MAEVLRQIVVDIRVETNKQTYQLYDQPEDLDDIPEMVNRFVEGFKIDGGEEVQDSVNHYDGRHKRDPEQRSSPELG